MKSTKRKLKVMEKKESEEAVVAYSRPVRYTRPGGSLGRSSRRIIHREYVADVNPSATTFSVVRYALNPGVAATFPWLSTQATGWEQYRFNHLKFEFITRSATSSTGVVILSPEYDASDVAPTTETQAMNVMDSVSDAIWKDSCVDLSVEAMYPLGPRKFIRSSRIAGDIRNFDSGALHVCTVVGAAANLGKLWVDYDVELFIPQTVLSNASTAYSLFDTTGIANTFTSTVGKVLAIGAGAPTTQQDALRWGYGTAGTWTPPAGTYLLMAKVCVTDNTAEEFTAFLSFRKSTVTIPTATGRFGPIAVAAGGRFDCYVRAIATFDGSETFDIYGVLTGAAGTLTAVAGESTLLICAA